MASRIASATARWVIDSEMPPAKLGFRVAASALEPLVLWLVGSAFAYMVGSSFFRGPETETDYLEVLRTTGFAFGPSVLRFLAWVPPTALGLSIAIALEAPSMDAI